MSKYCCFKGRGQIAVADYLANLAKTAGLIPVGNAPVFNINIAETVEKIKDYTSPAGGTACNFREIDEVTIDLSLQCHTPENLIRSLYGAGAADNVATAVVVAEPLVLHLGAMKPLDALIDDTVAVVVTDTTAATTYVKDTDYRVTPAGSIEHIVGGTIPAPTITSGVGQPNVKVSYTRKVQSRLQLFSKPSAPQVLHFDGYNIAGDVVLPVQFDLFKVSLSAAKTFSLIGDNMSRLELTGTAMRDSSKPVGTISNPMSQYGTLKI